MPRSFAYDVALSFAGEQRREAETIAKHLRAAGVRVFYDEYEQASLWGKNLYDHLTSIYHDQARYCVMLVSSAYATKVWTTLERQSAQARALKEHTEYILPVRFDNTAIPGLPDTTGYVPFAQHGPDGIARLILEKLGNATGGPTPEARITTSPRACIIDTEQALQAWPPVTKCTWKNNQATITFQPDDTTDGPFLDNLRNNRRTVMLALKNNAALARATDVQHEYATTHEQWTITFALEKTDFTPAMEMGMNGMTADQIAEQRARRVLLNENPAKETNDWNTIANQTVLQGLQTPLPTKESPIPRLYQHYGKNPATFLDIAWITSVITLKINGIIADITNLALTLKDYTLVVDFVGRRHKQYTNYPATIITVKGICNLR